MSLVVTSGSWRVGVAFALLLEASGCERAAQEVDRDAGGVDAHIGIDSGVADARADALLAYPPWDPVWHDTSVLQRDFLPPLPTRTCGPGCTVIFDGRVDLRDVWPTTDGHVIGSALGGVWLAPVAGGGTLNLVSNDAKNGAVWLYVQGDLAAYDWVSARYGKADLEHFELQRISTGERKTVYLHERDAGANGIENVSFNSRYAILNSYDTGIVLRDLVSGEVRQLSVPGAPCEFVCPTEEGLWCAATNRVHFVNFSTGRQETTDRGAVHMQLHASCDAQKAHLAFVDFRNESTGYSSPYSRYGGDVYVLDVATRQPTRITFDSPATPRAKMEPVYGDGIMAWRELPDGFDPNPWSGDEIGLTAHTLVRFVRNTGERCRYTSDVTAKLRLLYILDHTLIAAWLGDTAGQPGPRLVRFDLNDPAVPWICSAP